MIETKFTNGIAIMAIASLTAMIWLAPEPKNTTIAYNIALGIFVSSIFYFFVVWLPAKQRRLRIHNNFLQQYKSFKLSCISTFLIASNSQDYGPREMLLDQQEFFRYFKVEIGNNQNRWHAVMNGINGNEYLLRDILYELEIFREGTLYVLSMVDIHDEEVFSFLKRMSQIIYRMRDIKTEYDDIKTISGFLWEVFSGWSFIEGYRDHDIIESMINRI